jgi:hypothetical protein
MVWVSSHSDARVDAVLLRVTGAAVEDDVDRSPLPHGNSRDSGRRVGSGGSTTVVRPGEGVVCGEL